MVCANHADVTYEGVAEVRVPERMRLVDGPEERLAQLVVGQGKLSQVEEQTQDVG